MTHNESVILQQYKKAIVYRRVLHGFIFSRKHTNMQKILFFVGTVLMAGQLMAQGPLPKGQAQLNVGVGLSEWGIPVYLGIEKGVGNDFSIGGEASFRGYRERWNGQRYRHNITGIAANGNYHFNRILNMSPEWNFYAGLNLGFYIWDSPRGYNGPRSSGLGLGAQVGGRYYFSKKAGLNLEIGSGNAFSGGKFGLSFKL